MAGTGTGQPGPDGRHAGGVDQHLSLLVALPRHRDHTPLEVEVVHVEPAQLGHPHPAPVEQLEDGVVPDVPGGRRAWPAGSAGLTSGPSVLPVRPPGGSRPEQAVELGLTEDTRQSGVGRGADSRTDGSTATSPRRAHQPK